MVTKYFLICNMYEDMLHLCSHQTVWMEWRREKCERATKKAYGFLMPYNLNGIIIVIFLPFSHIIVYTTTTKFMCKYLQTPPQKQETP